MNFVLTNHVETRSDNPNLKGYRVYLGNKKYIMYYNKDILHEVYFMSEFPKYFMSCRVDLNTVSHYYYQDIPNSNYFLIKRYEKGILNRTYIVVSNNLTVSYLRMDDTERLYKTTCENLSNELAVNVQNDLLNFLEQFNKLNLYNLFSPQEP
jgi:hypothetical protein